MQLKHSVGTGDVMAIRVFCCSLILFSVLDSIEADERLSALELSGSDSVTMFDRNGEQVQVNGRIEEIMGETLTIRRDGRTQIQLCNLSDVTKLEFLRSSDWEHGLSLLRIGDEARALEFFDRALRKENRSWAWNELQATAAKTCILLGRRSAAVRRIEEIFEKDNRTRHVSLLPLTWDERLPATERIEADSRDLQSASEIRRLVAASALLHEPNVTSAAESVLSRIRRTSRQKRISEMAEAQLWRMHLLDSSRKQPLLDIWQDRVRQMPVAGQGGPQFILGRLFARHHDHDNAVLSLLWMPLMAPCDRALTAQAMSEGIESLKRAGRHSDAVALSAELQARFPATSAAKRRAVSGKVEQGAER